MHVVMNWCVKCCRLVANLARFLITHYNYNCWCCVCSEEKEEKDYSDSDSDSGSPVEVRPKKIPSLKIRLPMVAVRKSLREKKPAPVMTLTILRLLRVDCIIGCLSFVQLLTSFVEITIHLYRFAMSSSEWFCRVPIDLFPMNALLWGVVGAITRSRWLNYILLCMWLRGAVFRYLLSNFWNFAERNMCHVVI